MANNSLYKNIKINYCLLNTWDDEFITFGITNNIANYNFNHNKCLGYTANFCKNNHKNNLYVAIVEKRIEEDHIHSGYIYSNIDDRKKNLILQLLSAIGNIKASNSSLDLISPSVIFFCRKDWLILLND